MSHFPSKPEVPEGSCAFYIERKRRYCRFKPNSGQEYCAEHVGVLGIETSRKRIQCPLNPKHTCYEDQLNRHIKKCQKQRGALPIYHVDGINLGASSVDAGEDEAKIPWADIPLSELLSLIDKVKQKYKEHVGDIDTEILDHVSLEEELSNDTFRIPALRHRKQQASLIGHLGRMGLLKDDLCYVELGAGKGMLSHWIQKAVDKCQNTAFLLVDKGHTRYKADNQHKWDDGGPKFERIRMDIANLHLGRVPSIQESERPVVAVGKHLCGGATDLAIRCVTKTLGHQSVDNEGDDQQIPPCKKSKVSHTCSGLAGMAVALCCHHRCTWQTYTGKDFMKKCGFSAREFTLLCKLSGWAAATWKGWRTVEQMNQDLTSTTNSDKKEINSSPKSSVAETIPEAKTSGEDNPDFPGTSAGFGLLSRHQSETEPNMEGEQQEEEEHKTEPPLTRNDLSLPTETRETIGRQCKRLIDFGRVQYLRDSNLSCRLVVYIDERLTPENVAIIAQPKPSDSS